MSELGIEKLIVASIGALKARGVPFALCGGIVANYYRNTPRATKDVDIAIVAASDSRALAAEILEELGLSKAEVTEGMLTGGPPFLRKNSPVQLIVGRSAEDPTSGVDFILPAMPWVVQAVERAQRNLVNLGVVVEAPIVTREDLIISKLFSLQDKSIRVKDIDDIREVLKASSEVDNNYLIAQITENLLPIPESLYDHFHYTVQRVIRKKKRLVKDY